MSRHSAIDAVGLCAQPMSVAADWSKFVARSQRSHQVSPLDSFYGAHQGLNKLTSLIDSPHVESDVQGLLGGQLLLGYVSATELYFRQVVSRCVALCPIIRQTNHGQTIPFGALDYYDRRSLESALTERTSFSEPGTIKSQLESRLRVKVKPRSSLDQSIVDYEKLCQLRHSLVHSHGVINSSNAAKLGIAAGNSVKAAIDLRCLQVVASVTLNLVRDANNEIARSIIWSWIQEGILTGDGRKDRPRLARLIRNLGSAQDGLSGRAITDVAQLLKSVRTAIAAITMKGKA